MVIRQPLNSLPEYDSSPLPISGQGAQTLIIILVLIEDQIRDILIQGHIAEAEVNFFYHIFDMKLKIVMEI